jgi:hypothetical protein
MPTPSTNGFHVWDGRPPDLAADCAQEPDKVAGADFQVVPDVHTPQAPDFCARVKAVGDTLDALGAAMRSDVKSVDPADIASMIESVIQTGWGVSVGESVSGKIKERLDKALPTLDLTLLLRGWQEAVGRFFPGANDRLLNQLAARYVLQSLADFTVAWGAGESFSAGRGSSFSISGSLGI